MKSKSFELPQNSINKAQNKIYDFINYYDSSNVTEMKIEDVIANEGPSKPNSEQVKRARSPNKKKKKLKEDSMNISKINIESNLPDSSASHGSKVTSTPNNKGKKDLYENVKSIMKNASAMDNSLDLSTVSVPKHKPKKRNKSVSFMLEETEEVAIKRSKSELSVVDNKNYKKQKKPKKKSQDGKENKSGVGNVKVEMEIDSSTKDTNKQISKPENVQTSEAMDIPVTEEINRDKKKKRPKKTKPTSLETAAQEEDAPTTEGKERKAKKKKHQPKTAQEHTDTEGEPAKKSSKNTIKPEIIAQDLENLSIGDNAHTLTNLLDEMTVIDKKKKKNKRKPKKNKQITPDNVSTDTSEVKGEEKEKVKWIKRKWNKDKKGGVNDDKLSTTIIIENIPLNIMCNYKKLVTEHFEKFGTIRSVGVAEVYCVEQPEFFTTTINFENEDAANKALEEDNTKFEGSRIRVKRPLPPSQTTLVVRSYADLTELALSSVFTSAGRIRNIRRLVKGRKSMCTAFIEFDGPEAVERALKMAEDIKIGGKKIFGAKFELRNTNNNKKIKTGKENEDDAGSEDSSD